MCTLFCNLLFSLNNVPYTPNGLQPCLCIVISLLLVHRPCSTHWATPARAISLLLKSLISRSHPQRFYSVWSWAQESEVVLRSLHSLMWKSGSRTTTLDKYMSVIPRFFNSHLVPGFIHSLLCCWVSGFFYPSPLSFIFYPFPRCLVFPTTGAVLCKHSGASLHTVLSTGGASKMCLRGPNRCGYILSISNASQIAFLNKSWKLERSFPLFSRI